MRDGVRSLAAGALLGGWLCVCIGGCTQPKGDVSSDGGPGDRPSYAELRDRVNARSERLVRLWARATVVVHSVVEGEERTDQGDGYLQVVRPSRLSLSLGKSIDRMYFFLGSNEDRYWWVDTLDKDRRVALVGTLAEASPARAEEFGVPVHPLDLIELLGISGLAEVGDGPVWDGAAGGWSVTAAARFGTRRLVFDPVEWYPIVIELEDERGEVAARAVLEDYRRLAEFDGVGLRPEMPSRITIELARIDTTVLLDFGATKSIERLPRDIAFDLEALLRRERVEEVRDLDAPGGGGGG